jgi:hypothetical protein
MSCKNKKFVRQLVIMLFLIASFACDTKASRNREGLVPAETCRYLLGYVKSDEFSLTMSDHEVLSSLRQYLDNNNAPDEVKRDVKYDWEHQFEKNVKIVFRGKAGSRYSGISVTKDLYRASLDGFGSK